MSEATINERYEMAAVSKLRPHPENPRQGDLTVIRESIEANGFYGALVVNADGTVLAGNHRLLAAQELGITEVPVVRVDVDEDRARRILIADNRSNDLAAYDDEALADLLHALSEEPDGLAGTGFDTDDLDAMLSEEEGRFGEHDQSGALVEQFLVAPFSVLNARAGWWQNRKRAWLSLGIESEVGRGDSLISDGLTQLVEAANFEGISGTSVFDPVLCELAYRWFSPPGGVVLDPFAGGSVRGIIASRLGREYHGIELRPEQVAANREQAPKIVTETDPAPTWYEGDSLKLLAEGADGLPDQADFLFSCPPYADLEVYSDDPADLSNMSYSEFRETHAEIVKLATDRLAEDSFAVWVIGEVRGPDGGFYGLVPDTIQAFRDAGLQFVTEAVLVTAVGTLALRTRRTFIGSRALGRTHQNVLVFCKGDRKRAAKRLGDVDVTDALEALDAQAADPEDI